MAAPAVSKETLAAVDALHAGVDRALEPLIAANRSRMKCRRGCSMCCVDDLAVVAAEAALIVERHPDVLRDGPAPVGACAFLGAEGECRVHANRPYVCRTAGLPLRWPSAGGEARDLCELNGDPDDVDEEDCWTIGPVEARLEALSPGPRVRLRDLFGRV